ncbi:MAG: excinuclease ABC subunit UvrA [Desulfohalobiaceae bacterium]|nr:excinuclease ABC subunit UvrA [Desulfohalobiaceae bacterium]
MQQRDSISILGAQQHNLKNLDLDIPRNQLVVICGPSGSGKSTLAFDIVYAEGQRRYVESLSAYARQFLPQLDKPKVEKIEGLSPAISLEQHVGSKNPRSTVGTMTEIHDYLRVFFARLSTPHCPRCGEPIQAMAPDEIVDAVLNLPGQTRFMLLAPLVERERGNQAQVLKKLRGQGFVRVRVDGAVHRLENPPELEDNAEHSVEVVVDRLVLRGDIRKRLADSLELALRMGQGRVVVSPLDGEELFYTTEAVCPRCHIGLPEPSPQLFSFNSPQGACPECSGIGSREFFDPLLLAPNQGLSLEQGGIIPWKKERVLARYRDELRELGLKRGFDLTTPLREFSRPAWNSLFYGDSEANWPGVVGILDASLDLGRIWQDELARFRRSMPCPACGGGRLRPESLSFLVDGANIRDVCSWSIRRALDWMASLSFQGMRESIAEPILRELTHRLDFLQRVGLDYLSLDRNMSTLAGGEAQRIRLAGQLGSGLVGVTYVLDEPSIGLHPRDNQRLLQSLKELQGRGNTVLVVEHDEPTIRASDYVLELGPGSGARGGEVVYSGGVQGLLHSADSLTGKYLRGELTVPVPEERRNPTGWLRLKKVRTNNIKGEDIDLPLGTMVCVTGVSGSGKSSLVVDSLYKHLALNRGIKVEEPGRLEGIEGEENVEKVISIDQSPIGRTPRSNPATYTKVFDDIRKIFASTQEAKMRGFTPGRFSFNVRGGRCEACQGDGHIRVEMHFLPDVFVTCDVCGGKRYNRETLDVEYKGLNISQVLDLSVRQAREFFTHHPSLKRRLEVLEKVGLEYLSLGQPATTLSGGEAQRLKISRELGKRSLPRTLYILDEPTTGLHMHEVGKLLQVLRELVQKGATVVVIEHNLDVIRAADCVLDLGPGGGEFGGRVVARGTPEQVRDDPDSPTGEFLRAYW